MKTQLLIYEELKKGKIMSREQIKVFLNTSIQNAGQHFNKVAKLEGVQIIQVEEERANTKQHFLVQYLKFNI